MTEKDRYKVVNVNYGVTHVPYDHNIINIIDYFELGKIYSWNISKKELDNLSLSHLLSKENVNHLLSKENGGVWFTPKKGDNFLCHKVTTIRLREEFRTKKQIYMVKVNFISPDGEDVKDCFHSEEYKFVGIRKIKEKWHRE